MSAASTVRPAERLALMASTLAVLLALPVPPDSSAGVWLPAYVLPVLIGLGALPWVRKVFGIHLHIESLRYVFWSLLLIYVFWLPLVGWQFVWFIMSRRVVFPGSPAGPLAALSAVAAFVGAFLPVVVTSLVMLEPSEGRWRLLRTLGLVQVGAACLLSPSVWVRGLVVASLALLVLALAPYRPDAGKYLVLGGPAPAPARGRSLWRLVALGVAVACALLTPPLRLDHGGFGRLSLPPGTIIDLNETGPIRLSRAVAVRVRAEGLDGSPKNDLPRDLRFRHKVKDYYGGGRWAVSTNAEAHHEAGEALADLGPSSYVLEFRCRSGSMAPVAAEPVRMAPGEPRSPISRRSGKGGPLFLESSGTLRANPSAPKPPPRYRQVVPADADRHRTPAGVVTPAEIEHLQRPPQPEIVEFAVALLTRLAEQRGSGLEGADVELLEEAAMQERPTVPANAARVAVAVTRHLAWSGEYVYSLDRPRRDFGIDPTLDFLQNVREGHCERFASGLALILRSWQIPCRVVVGYHGAERVGDGSYVVRQRAAHAWVEALVPRPGEEGEFDWLTLDPTPGSTGFVVSGGEGSDWGDWWGEWWDGLFDGEDDPREWLWQDFLPAWWPWLVAAVALIVLPLLVRAFIRRSKRPLPTTYARLLALLARHGHPPPKKGQTPADHAATAAADLGSDVPLLVVAAHYRERFGAEPPTPEEARRLDEALDGLARLLPRRRRWFLWRRITSAR
jgi:transglutaminase-like putative cysteine protease